MRNKIIEDLIRIIVKYLGRAGVALPRSKNLQLAPETARLNELHWIACEESFFERSDTDATVSHQETSLRTNMRVGGGGKDGKSCIADKQAK